VIVVFILTQPVIRSLINLVTKVSSSAASTTRIVATLDEARDVVYSRLRSVNDDDVTLPDR
jgi:hypothetical protein